MLNKVIASPTSWILLLLLIISWFFLTYRILVVPPGINGDEAVIGLNASLVARTGVDARGRFLPLFTVDKDSLDWKQPVTFYSTVLAFRLFGHSYFTLRVVSVVFALLSGSIIFFLIKELLGIKQAMFGLIVFILTPIVVIQSHLGLENIAPVPFISLWLLMLIKYYKRQKNRYIVISALALGVSFYSYLGLRLIMPTLAVISLMYIYLINRSFRSKKILFKLLIFIISLLPFLVLLILVKNSYPGAILAVNRPSNLSSYQELILPYLSSFDPSFLFIKGDSTPYHSTGKHGMFLLATFPLFALGIYKLAQKNNFITKFILLTFFVIPILYSLTASIHRASRLLVFLPFYIIFICFGLDFISGVKREFWRLVFIIVIFILIALNSVDFIYDYWYEYPKRVKSEFARSYHLVFKRAHQLAKEKGLQVFIQHDFRVHNSIAIDFFEEVYFPDKLKLWKEGQSLPQNSLLIASDHDLSTIKGGKIEIFGDNGFGLLINQSKNEIKQ